MLLLPLLLAGMTGDVAALDDPNDAVARVSVFHRASNATVHQLSSGGAWEWGWTWADLTTNQPETSFVPAANAKFSAGLTHLGKSVFFRSTTDHMVQAFYSNQYGWLATDLGSGAGDPVFYNRYDGTNAVVFRLANNHVQEITWSGGNVIRKDLTALTAAPLATSDPSANARDDGYNSVVFNTASGVIELYSTPTSAWFKGGPQSLAGAPNATGRPFEYTRRDHSTVIVYRSIAKIIELRLSSTGWHWSDITAGGEPPAGDPVGRVRVGGVDHVVYRSWNGKIIELTSTLSGPWQSWNLTAQYGAPNATTDPTLFSPGSQPWDIVLFGTATTHADFFKFSNGYGWSTGDVSTLANEP